MLIPHIFLFKKKSNRLLLSFHVSIHPSIFFQTLKPSYLSIYLHTPPILLPPPLFFLPHTPIPNHTKPAKLTSPPLLIQQLGQRPSHLPPPHRRRRLRRRLLRLPLLPGLQRRHVPHEIRTGSHVGGGGSAVSEDGAGEGWVAG